MEIEPSKSTFYVLPTFAIIKVKNTLTKESQKTFDYEWDDFYYIKFGWLKWTYKYNF